MDNAEKPRRRWRSPNAESMAHAIECHESLRRACGQAGGDISFGRLKTMTALDLLLEIAPNGIRFYNE